MSADYYGRLEQGRSPQPSTQLLAQNAMARDLLGGVCTVSEHGRNVVWRWFTDLSARDAYAPEEHEHHSRLHVADLRAAYARRGKDAAATRLVTRLRAASDEFTRLWNLHEAGVLRGNRMRVRHPSVGEFELGCEVLASPAADQRLFVFTAPPGSPSVELLERLRAVAV